MSKFFELQQLHVLIVSHFKELIREPGVLFWGIIFPILMSLGLGIAFTKKADIVRSVAIAETKNDSHIITEFLQTKTIIHNPQDQTEDTQYEITITNEKLGNITFLFQKTDWDEAMTLLKRGKISVILSEDEDGIKYHFDPSNPDAQLTYMQLANLLDSETIASEENTDIIEPLTLSGTRYIDFLIPGLIAMNIMMSCMWGISYGMIEKRSKKLLRRMVATPMKKSHFLIAIMSVRIVMNLIEALLLFLFAHIVFDISIQGNIAALVLIFVAGNIAFAGIAIFISSHTANTEIGNGLINAIVFPMVVLSGIFFSYHNFPEWSQPIIAKLPLTLLADGIRSIFIEGAGFAQTSLASFLLLGLGMIFFVSGLKIFKWH
jgi:ABC-2 type transport system permease protein